MGSSSRPDVLLAREIDTPVGRMRAIASPRGLRALMWRDEHVDEYAGVAGQDIRDDGRNCAVLDLVEVQLGEYFAGRRRAFDLPLDPIGTDFQMSAWRVLSTIPYGTTISYADQARILGDVRKARAVGGANGRNPIPIIVPCHRVIAADGTLGGFAVGTEIKTRLLDLEKS